MIIKALSLWQPWAALIAAGHKKFETRSRLTHHRGPLLICSSRRTSNLQTCVEHDFVSSGATLEPWMRKLGMALCIVDVVDVFKILRNETMVSIDTPTIGRGLPSRPEYYYGDYGFGRYAWQLANLRPLKEKSFPVTGRQFLFDVEIDPKLLEAA